VSRFESWTIHLSTLLVGGTGLIYAWMVYWVHSPDPYAVVNHPLQPQVQHWHVLFAPLLVFAVGLIWQRHVWSHWQRNPKNGKKSGRGMVFTLVPMVASGYLIQTAVDGSWRKAWVIVHLLASALWLAGYLAHQLPLVWSWLKNRRLVRRGDYVAPAVLHLERRSRSVAEEPEHRRARSQRSQP
jgi:hypothetical protein